MSERQSLVTLRMMIDLHVRRRYTQETMTNRALALRYEVSGPVRRNDSPQRYFLLSIDTLVPAHSPSIFETLKL